MFRLYLLLYLFSGSTIICIISKISILLFALLFGNLLFELFLLLHNHFHCLIFYYTVIIPIILNHWIIFINSNLWHYLLSFSLFYFLLFLFFFTNPLYSLFFTILFALYALFAYYFNIINCSAKISCSPSFITEITCPLIKTNMIMMAIVLALIVFVLFFILLQAWAIRSRRCISWRGALCRVKKMHILNRSIVSMW